MTASCEMQGRSAGLATNVPSGGGQEEPTGRAFFEMIRVHTIEGMLADPAYGGNKGFVMGSSTFPSMGAGFNPTLTIQATAYLTADALLNRYKKSPGPLV